MFQKHYQGRSKLYQKYVMDATKMNRNLKNLVREIGLIEENKFSDAVLTKEIGKNPTEYLFDEEITESIAHATGASIANIPANQRKNINFIHPPTIPIKTREAMENAEVIDDEVSISSSDSGKGKGLE